MQRTLNRAKNVFVKEPAVGSRIGNQAFAGLPVRLSPNERSPPSPQRALANFALPQAPIGSSINDELLPK